jgi:DNA-directed RNA polymerase specialized sigma24 family protein
MASAVTPRHDGAGEVIAREALALRAILIRVHADQGSREDLEDLFSQAILELLKRARRDSALNTPGHVRNALRQKFASRIVDHRRALAGRSAAAHIGTRTCPLELVAEQLVGSQDTARYVLAREEIRAVTHAMGGLTRDQRLVISSRLNGESPSQCCERTGWTIAKYRKLSQRARARLRTLSAAAG